mmetsp:Transcript_3557/g.4762  ORF Transcript_3557/g.4762 Transcript_3557/m.4762 type:complete len:305 (+) Transcript_3557:279-1193(+)|eukprot:CAMPEP_0184019858 /NCGR_PEP_ID=MMETSP0954-20121128/8999_1 /TAXON_ID=627963 /ORGANISM="Aplanochytrium sp, Strain PBS07" /LENGTH=304 /DNA_ID=CAMNT_0026301599 /DNA_START=203 /DNA_END=1117 /DNA_ORIENTATION=-
MGSDIINLQNSPLPDGIECREVSFESNGFQLKGNLYIPTSSKEDKLGAVVVCGAWTTVKEQMSGTYAREISRTGFAALAFDYTGWGESEGTPRFVEDPKTKTADIIAAGKFLSSCSFIDETRIHGLGVCASSGYMLEAVSSSPLFKKVALIAPWLHDRSLAENVYGGKENVETLIQTSDQIETKDSVAVAASVSDEKSIMYKAPYYTEKTRGLIPEYDNKFALLSWKPWLTYNAFACVETLSKPVFIVWSPSIALYDGAVRFVEKAAAPVKQLYLGKEVSQFEFYDNKKAVKASVDAVVDFLTD